MPVNHFLPCGFKTRQVEISRIHLDVQMRGYTTQRKVATAPDQIGLLNIGERKNLVQMVGVGQCQRQFGRMPDAVVACVGGGSNAAGMFHPFVDYESVRLVGIEAGGRSGKPGDHAASLSFGSPGILHGSLSYVLQDADGQTADVHSVSAGLDYPGVGPEHSYWRDLGRVEYTNVTDEDSLDAFDLVARREGILPALETSHALAWAVAEAARRPADEIIVVCLSGRGDKDAAEIARLRGLASDGGPV